VSETRQQVVLWETMESEGAYVPRLFIYFSVYLLPFFCFVYQYSTYVYRYKHLIFCGMSTMYLFDLYNFVYYEKIKDKHT
jgi:hypothetical protein